MWGQRERGKRVISSCLEEPRLVLEAVLTVVVRLHDTVLGLRFCLVCEAVTDLYKNATILCNFLRKVCS